MRPGGRAGASTSARLRLLVPLGVLLGLLFGDLAVAGRASAHATLVTSTPEDGTRVATQPVAVRLKFDEAIGMIASAERVISTTGLQGDTGHPQLSANGTTIVLPLKPNLPAGTYSATWRVVSADTHIVSGSITFGLRVQPGAGVAAPADHTRALAVADDVARALGYAGIVLLIGVVGLVVLLWRWARSLRRIRVLAWTGWALVFLGAAGEFLLQGPRAANASWAAFIRLRGAGQTLDSAYGTQLLVRVVVLVVIAALLMRAQRPGRSGVVLGGLSAAALLVTIAITGHEGVGSAALLAVASAVLHLAAMSVWLGGLVVLVAVVLPALRRGRIAPADARLHRWSAVAYTCVVVLVITGEYQAARQISPIQALWSTRYGVLLLIKVGLLAAILVVAYLTQRRIRPGAPLSAAVTSARSIGRGVAVEGIGAALILVVTAILVSEPPARETYGPAVTLAAPLGADHASVHVDTTRRGPQSFEIRILDPHDDPVAAESMTATLSSPTVASLNVTLRKTAADGSVWASRNAVAPLPGIWTLTLNVALTGDDAYATSGAYRVW